MNMKIASLKLIEKRLLKQVPSLAFCGSGAFFKSRHAGDPRATGKVGMLAQRRRSAENSMKANNQQTCSERARAVDQWRIGLDKGGGSRAVDHLIGATPMADGAHSWTCAAPRKRLGSPGEAAADGRGAVGGYRAAVDGNTEVDGDTGVDGDRVVDDNTGEGDSTGADDNTGVDDSTGADDNTVVDGDGVVGDNGVVGGDAVMDGDAVVGGDAVVDDNGTTRWWATTRGWTASSARRR